MHLHNKIEIDRYKQAFHLHSAGLMCSTVVSITAKTDMTGSRCGGNTTAHQSDARWEKSPYNFNILAL